MDRKNHAIISALTFIVMVGCGQKPAEGDIDMGARAPQQPATSASRPSDAGSAPAGPAALDLLPVMIEDMQTVRVVATCNIEMVNGQAFTGSPVAVPKDAPVSVNGWLVDEGNSGVAELRLINIADASTYKVKVETNIEREDVAASFKADVGTRKPGFNVEFNADDLPKGDYHLQIVIPSSDKGVAACDNGRVVSLTD